jgi:hypothetical protein
MKNIVTTTIGVLFFVAFWLFLALCIGSGLANSQP